MSENTKRYLAAMAQAKIMLQKRIISAEDYSNFDTIMSDKYSINSCSLYRSIDLLYR
ncbi:MAG: hypothetical protein PHY15_05110 [Eubacteriales bacterium]|nr:hypothetical protein [Eubacteriales bacterium]MDD4474474.1 hypothetical protein [Eubacteriales bacterium]